MKKHIIIAVIAIFSASSSLLGQRSSVDLFKTDEASTSRVRANLFYDLPVGIKGYSFLDVFADGENYYGESYLCKTIIGAFGVQYSHYASSFFHDFGGLGVIATVVENENTCLAFSFTPYYREFHGKARVKDFMIAQYLFQMEFTLHPLGRWRINSVGYMNVAAQGGPQWYYGEAYLEKFLGTNVYIGAGADLFAGGEWYPDPAFALKLGWAFGKK